MRHRLLSLCAAIVLGATPALSTAAPAGLQFTAPDGRISIWVPAAPKTSQDDFPSRTGSPYHRTTYAVEAANGLLLAGVLDFHDHLPTTGDEQGYLDTMLKSLTSGFGPGFQLAPGGMRSLRLAGSDLPGREIVGTVQGQCIVFRAYVGKNTIYMLEAGGSPGDKEMMATIDRFLASLVVDKDR
jgi:hypothetical protein